MRGESRKRILSAKFLGGRAGGMAEEGRVEGADGRNCCCTCCVLFCFISKTLRSIKSDTLEEKSKSFLILFLVFSLW